MDDFFWLTISCIKGVGNKTVIKLFELDPHMNFNQVIKELSRQSKKFLIDETVIENAKLKAENIIKTHNDLGIEVISISSKYYPKYLKLIDDPPAVLYAKGNLELLTRENLIAVVGTREPTELGILAARKIASNFAERGYVIVSGLALGIDTAGHEGAIRIENGETIAVMAGDLNTIYPAKNKGLAMDILNKNGLWLSETAIGKANTRGNFVQRDRIQSGLSLGVCPVQTPIKSGTQHTIEYAKKQKRLLFTPVPLPKDLDEDAIKGNVELINQGVLKLENKNSYNEIELGLKEIKLKLSKRYDERFSFKKRNTLKNEVISKQINIFEV